MELGVLECPYCGGNVRLNPEMEAGDCASCGKHIVSKEYPAILEKVRADRKMAYGYVVEAKGILESKRNPLGKDPVLRRLVNEALTLDPGNTDAWYLNAALTMCESGVWDGTSDNIVSSAMAMENNRPARYFTYSDCMNVKKEADKILKKVSSKVMGSTAFLIFILFFAMFAGIPIMMAVAGVMPWFVVAIVVTMVLSMALFVGIAMALGKASQ
ncbi:MAG: hypothetical protein GX224_03415 [Thermoplasmatales archaeon]|nr:hypothetical protein [Thermoplasmatales archaeon]